MKSNIPRCLLPSRSTLLRRFLPMVLGAAVLGGSVPTAVAQTVFAVADNGGTTDLFGSLNLATGQFTSIASSTNIYLGLTADPGGTIYGITIGSDSNSVNGALYTITPAGVSTRYGTLGLSNVTAYGLAYGNGGFLTDVFQSPEVDLYNITANGNSIHLIGTLQTGAFQVTSGSLVFGPGGTLYFEDNPASGSSNKPALFSVNPATGAKTPIGAGLSTTFLTLVSTATTLYGIDTVDAANIGVYTINTTTGVATQISTVNGLPAGYTLDAAASVPEPSNWALLGLGGAGLGLILRRRRRAA